MKTCNTLYILKIVKSSILSSSCLHFSRNHTLSISTAIPEDICSLIIIHFSSLSVSSLLLNYVLLTFIKSNPYTQSALEAWYIAKTSRRWFCSLYSSCYLVNVIVSWKVFIAPPFIFSAVISLKSEYSLNSWLKYISLSLLTQ